MLHNSLNPQVNAQEYGIDWDGPLPQEDYEADQIEVPDYNCPLSEEQYRVLQDRISPLAVSSNHGIDLYIETLELVEDVLSS